MFHVRVRVVGSFFGAAEVPWRVAPIGASGRGGGGDCSGSLIVGGRSIRAARDRACRCAVRRGAPVAVRVAQLAIGWDFDVRRACCSSPHIFSLLRDITQFSHKGAGGQRPPG